jgi:histidinol dehydrogenase
VKRIEWAKLSSSEKSEALSRPALSQKPELSAQVSALIKHVREKGDTALRELTQKFDRVLVQNFEVSQEEFEHAESSVSPELRSAMARAFEQIWKFHECQRRENYTIETSPGILCERRFSPIEKVGLYVPGGSATLPSTLLMIGVPALLADSKLRIVCTPPAADGSVNPAILVAAKLCKIHKVYKVGGAQAVAAMAYGTESVPKVDKIFGPGNAYVTQAKTLVAQDALGAASDLPAGPSEVLVIADGSAPANFTAADLLSQAEHGADSQVILLSPSSILIDEILGQIDDQVALLPRASIARAALGNSLAIEVRDIAEALEISESYAPEHLILQVKNARDVSKSVTNAGSVFLGAWSPESVGDYASGTNHVLPTYGFAKTYSGLSLDAFFKSTTFQELTREGLMDIASTVENLARCEDLIAHERAVTIRRRALDKENT